MGSIRGSISLLRIAAFCTAAIVTTSATISGAYAFSLDIGSSVAQYLRLPHGPYTQTPTKPYLGNHPGRDPVSRGGKWNRRLLQDLRAGALQRRIDHDPEFRLASLDPFAALQAQGGGDEGSGGPTGGEGGTGSGGSGSTGGGGSGSHGNDTGTGTSGVGNTNNGNNLTTLPIVDWNARGAVPIDLTLFHNSFGTFVGLWGQSWSSTYDAELTYTSGSSAIIRWGDGTADPYTEASGIFSPPVGVFDALVRNTGGDWTVTKANGVKFNFDSNGRLASIIDRNANTTSISRNTGGQITYVTDPTGRQLSFSYNTAGFVSSVADPLSRTWTFTYDVAGNLTDVAYPVLNATTYHRIFGYDSLHNITTETDPRGKVWSWTYDSSERIASFTNPLSKTWTWAYTSTSTAITDPLGHATTDNYSSGLLASRVDRASFSVSFTAYDSNHDVTSVTDGRGKAWGYTYDSKGNVLSKTDPLSHTTTITYNSYSEPLTVTDPLSHVTTYTYDANGNRLTAVDALSHTIQTNTYDSYGQLSTTKNGVNKTTTLGYDADGNLTSTTDPLSRVTTIAYDGLSRALSTTDPLSHTESLSYDAWGRPVTITHADSTTYSRSYDASNNLIGTTDENAHSTTYAYDDANRLTSRTNANSEVESYGYDNANRRTSVTNGRGKTRTYTLTNRGESTSLTMPDGAVEQWAYDGEGNITSYTNPLAQTINYAYDDAGRQTGVDYPTGTDTAFTYDNADRASTMVDSTGTTTWGYDNANRTISLSTPQGNLTYAFDNASRRTSMTDSSGTTSYTYTNASELKTLTNPLSEVTTWNYDTAGRVTRQFFSNGQNEVITYDSRNRQLTAKHYTSGMVAVSSETYTYENNGNLHTKVAGGVTTTYGYDAIDQLTGESRTGYSASYTYDANGNRTSKTLGGVTEAYNVDDGDKLTSVTNGATTVKSFGYDAAGRTTSVTTSAGTTTLAYDYEDRVTGITYPTSTTNSFTYNGLDTRVGKTDSSGTATYRRDGVAVTSPVLSDGAATYTPGVSQSRSGVTTYDLADRMGSMTRQTDVSTATTATRSFDAFGMSLGTTGIPQAPFGFAGAFGYQEDPNSGLKLLGHRYYDSSAGRFITRDNAKDGRNWYTYGRNAPATYYDADGQRIKSINDRIGGNAVQDLIITLLLIGQTERGSIITNELFDGDTEYEIILTKSKSKAAVSFYDPESHTININVNDFEGEYEGKDNKKHKFTEERVIAHEFGHIFINQGNGNPGYKGEQYNVDFFENVIMNELGDYLDRGKYAKG